MPVFSTQDTHRDRLRETAYCPIKVLYKGSDSCLYKLIFDGSRSQINKDKLI